MILFKDGQKVIILIHKFAINFSSEIKHEYIKNDFIFFQFLTIQSLVVIIHTSQFQNLYLTKITREILPYFRQKKT